VMPIPALEDDPRVAFRALRALREKLRGRYPEVVHLSMGMSRDFEAAVEEGATIVRLGEVLFGPRERWPNRGVARAPDATTHPVGKPEH
jgi:PLP dependent protein